MIPPGARAADPAAEVALLTRQRLQDAYGQPADGPRQEWAIRHPDGQITVSASGPPFGTRPWAEGERQECVKWCYLCAGGDDHALMVRDIGEWRPESDAAGHEAAR